LPIILEVNANLLFEKRDVAVSLLLNEGIGSPDCEQVQPGEVERAAAIRLVVEAATAPVG